MSGASRRRFERARVGDPGRGARDQRRCRGRAPPASESTAGARRVEIARRREEQPRAAALEHGADLRRLVGRVERHGDGADAQHAEIRRDPARVVVGENRDPVAATLNPRVQQPRGHAARPAPRAARRSSSRCPCRRRAPARSRAGPASGPRPRRSGRRNSAQSRIIRTYVMWRASEASSPARPEWAMGPREGVRQGAVDEVPPRYRMSGGRSCL